MGLQYKVSADWCGGSNYYHEELERELDDEAMEIREYHDEIKKGQHGAPGARISTYQLLTLCCHNS